MLPFKANSYQFIDKYKKKEYGQSEWKAFEVYLLLVVDMFFFSQF